MYENILDNCCFNRILDDRSHSNIYYERNSVLLILELVEKGIIMMATKLKVANMAELQKDGIDALKNALGVVDTIRFLEQFDHGGSGDYTAEKYNAAEEPEEEICKKLGL